jgi:hypothetical protein
MKHLKLAFLALAPMLTAGCDSMVGSTVCATVAEPAIKVQILDSVSLVPVAPEEALVVARDGAFSDTARASLPGSNNGTPFFWLAAERAGTYAVTVQHPGYALWQRAGVRVTHDGCHVRTVQLTALLQPTS